MQTKVDFSIPGMLGIKKYMQTKVDFSLPGTPRIKTSMQTIRLIFPIPGA